MRAFAKRCAGPIENSPPAAGSIPTPSPRDYSARRTRPDEVDFKFLEQHFNDLALRMGYIQPRASQVPLKHFELQPDTLRVLMLSASGIEAGNAIPLDDVCERLGETWSVVVGALGRDLEALREQDYFGFDEEDLRHNTAAFAHRLKSLNMAFEPSDGLVLLLDGYRGSALNRDGYIAQAAALEVARVIRDGGHFFCPELPAMDVQRFLSALAELADDMAGVSLALVGYDVSETELRGPAERHGAARRARDDRSPCGGEVAKRAGQASEHHCARDRALPGRQYARALPARQRPHPCGKTARMGADRAGGARIDACAEVTPRGARGGARPVAAGVAERDRGVSRDLEKAGQTTDAPGAPRSALPRLGVLPDRKLFGATDAIADRDPFDVLDEEIGWDRLVASREEIAALGDLATQDPLSLATQRYAQLRRFAPAFREAFEFDAPAAGQGLQAAVTLLRELNRTGKRNLSDIVPMPFPSQH